MEVAQVSQGNALINQKQELVGSAVSNRADLFVRTREGDTVSLSINSDASFSQSAKRAQFQDGTTVQEFSVEAQAAFEYSLTVQGDLSQEELAAIQDLAGKVTPIAQNFFSNEEFDLKGAAQSLDGSLDVIQEVGLKLEKVVVQTFSSQEFSRLGGQKNPAQGNPVNGGTEGNAPDGGTDGNAGIRDLAALVDSVVGSVFRQEGAPQAGNEFLAQTLSELTQIIREKLLQFFEPLNPQAHENPPVTGGPDTPPGTKETTPSSPPENPPEAAIG